MIPFHRRLPLTVLLGFVCYAYTGEVSKLKAVTGYSKNFVNDPLPESSALNTRVKFWERIFLQYPSTTVIVHDVDNLDRIIDIIDFKLLSEQRGLKLPNRDLRDRQSLLFLKRYNQALGRFAKHGKTAETFGPMEKRIFDVYGRNRQSLADLYKGRVKIRIQGGLRDEFEIAIKRAEPFLPYMEEIFRAYKIPTDLTRLAFVESMFNINARSKVGASGIWQFMPKTAKKFMYVNSFIDERNSPLKSTKAAAQLLAINFQDLESWPVAVTAYNHGTGGMLKAIKKTGSRDIATIIEHYESPSFGFASKNFYAEFLAARKAFPQLLKESKKDLPLPKVQLEVITLDQNLSVADLLKAAPMDKKILGEYNKCLLPRAFDTYVNKKLPPYFQIFVPKDMADGVYATLQKLKNQRIARRE